MEMTLFEKYFTFGTTQGERVPVLTEKINLSALYKRHAKSGFVILSASLDDKDAEYNERQTGRLISDLVRSGFRYLPVYGDCRGKDGMEDDREPSFLGFPYDRNGNELNCDDLENFALAMCGKYGQDSVFVSKPEESPHYLDANGKPAEKRSSMKLFVNDLARQCIDEKLFAESLSGMRVNPPHDSLQELQKRLEMGEIVLGRKGGRIQVYG